VVATPIRLYFITDRTQTLGRPLAEVVTAAVQAGVDAVQLREKDLPSRELIELARVLLPICRAHGARLLINDRIDVLLSVDADGVHLPASSFACQDARRLVGDKLVGVSAHSVAEVADAAACGADFAVLGPIHATPSKAAYGQPLGTAVLTEASRRVRIPVLALGGIGPNETSEARRCGAAGVGVVRAISRAVDVRAAAATLLDALVVE
jgi:thiamine-phosphate pyrophosphorylase